MFTNTSRSYRIELDLRLRSNCHRAVYPLSSALFIYLSVPLVVPPGKSQARPSNLMRFQYKPATLKDDHLLFIPFYPFLSMPRLFTSSPYTQYRIVHQVLGLILDVGKFAQEGSAFVSTTRDYARMLCALKEIVSRL